ncbi:MAG: SMI1/KNR4 family protein [Actinomycetota bacterium]|nr:SMI1/KNR4 family protein [Actinomycetota bacterium]
MLREVTKSSRPDVEVAGAIGRGLGGRDRGTTHRDAIDSDENEAENEAENDVPADEDDDPAGQEAGTVAGTWLDSYVYIGLAGMGGGVFVDLRPGPLRGCVRFWDKVEADDDGDDGGVVASSFTDLLHRVTRIPNDR